MSHRGRGPTRVSSVSPLRSSTPLLAALCALLALACDGDREERALDRLERLVFVPVASPVIGAEIGAPVDCSNSAPFLVDSFEVTREEWSAWLESLPADDPARQSPEFWLDGSPVCPATGMTLAEAEAFAASRGMRLPSATEWLRIAVGRLGRQPFPWKPVDHASVANTAELGLGRLAPVGTFENGSTPSGVYDLHGNAAEWVASIDLAPFPGSGDQRTWAMGGSYRSHKRPTFSTDPRADLDADGQVDSGLSFNAFLLDPGSRSSDVGLRLLVDAERWLREQASELGADAASLARLERIGAGWGRDAVPLLRRLEGEAGEAPQLAALLRGAGG